VPASTTPRSDYSPRVVDRELDLLLEELAALSIEGPKGVGKTATAARRARTRFDLDDPRVLDIVRADPSRLLVGDEPILIDEWQRFEPSWDLVRRAVDQRKRPGRFILTGSASNAAPNVHSGAGRIVTLRMRPMTLAERRVDTPSVSLSTLLHGGRPAVAGTTHATLDTYADEIVRGGFPGLREGTPRGRRAQLDAYLQRVIDRDVPEYGRPVRNPAALRAWLTAYAAATATPTTYESIRDAATPGVADKPAKTTTQPYRDTLMRLWLVDPVPAWLPTRNRLVRLAAAPKHHLADPALAARLLGVSTEALLSGDDPQPKMPRDGTLLGALFESLVTLDVRVYAQAAEARVLHLRTRGGEREVDLVVERDDHRVVAVEVKFSATVTDADVRHLRWLSAQLGPDLLDAVVVTTGREAYRRADGIAVVPAALLGP
jgi:predicted AAA+ superfamily ATPase